jgi:chromate transporter
LGYCSQQLYQPVWVSAIRFPADVALVLLAFLLLEVLKWQPWLVVISSAVAAEVVRLL